MYVPQLAVPSEAERRLAEPLPEFIDLGKPGQDCFSDGVWHPEGHRYEFAYDDVIDLNCDCPPIAFIVEECVNCGRTREL